MSMRAQRVRRMCESRSVFEQPPESACHGLDAAEIEVVFSHCFASGERTRLLGGAQEPLYQPTTAQGGWHQIFYRLDYAASALHEVAHWCIAGTVRRQQLDYGYWYQPEGRDASAQRAFASVEALPQALEWVFSQAARRSFRLSLDNLDASLEPEQTRHFAESVLVAAQGLQARGLPTRAACFASALAARARGPALAQMRFSLPMLSGPGPLE